MMTFSVNSSKIRDLQHWGHTKGSKNKLDGHQTEDCLLSTFFIRHIALSTFLLILDLFEHILEHSNGPLSGLFWRTEKCRTGDLRDGAFSIRH